MARTPSKRLVEMVEKVSFRLVLGGPDLVSADMAATLLSRQHAAFVRLVKQVEKRYGGMIVARNIKRDLLAALQQGGKK